MLGIRLDPELERRLSALAASRGRTKSDVVREAIRHYLDAEAFLAEARRQSLLVSQKGDDEASDFAYHAADLESEA